MTNDEKLFPDKFNASSHLLPDLLILGQNQLIIYKIPLINSIFKRKCRYIPLKLLNKNEKKRRKKETISNENETVFHVTLIIERNQYRFDCIKNRITEIR